MVCVAQWCSKLAGIPMLSARTWVWVSTMISRFLFGFFTQQSCLNAMICAMCFNNITSKLSGLHVKHPIKDKIKKNVFFMFKYMYINWLYLILLVKACPLLSLDEEKVNILKILQEKRLIFECQKPYYPIEGDNQMDCLPNGTWIGKPLKCGCKYKLYAFV